MLQLKKKTVVVIGNDSATIQTLTHLLTYLDNLLFDITLIIPQRTKQNFVECASQHFLLGMINSTDLNFLQDLKEFDGKLCFGIDYENWRKHNFNLPYQNVTFTYDHDMMFEFAIKRFSERWGEKLKVIYSEKLENLKDSEEFPSLEIDGVKTEFDFIIDCSDSFISNKNHLNQVQIANKCIETTVDQVLFENNVVCRATEFGMINGISSNSKTTIKYFYDNNIFESKDIQSDIFKQFDLNNCEFIEYDFSAHIAKDFFGSKVFRSGHRAFSLEPLFFNITELTHHIDIGIFQYFTEQMRSPVLIKDIVYFDFANRHSQLCSYFYHGGTLYDNDYWKKICEETENFLEKEGDIFFKIRERLRFMDGRNFYAHEDFVFNEKKLKYLDSDKCLGYNYFKARNKLIESGYKRP